MKETDALDPVEIQQRLEQRFRRFSKGFRALRQLARGQEPVFELQVLFEQLDREKRETPGSDPPEGTP